MRFRPGKLCCDPSANWQYAQWSEQIIFSYTIWLPWTHRQRPGYFNYTHNFFVLTSSSFSLIFRVEDLANYSYNYNSLTADSLSFSLIYSSNKQIPIESREYYARKYWIIGQIVCEFVFKQNWNLIRVFVRIVYTNIICSTVVGAYKCHTILIAHNTQLPAAKKNNMAILNRFW